ncbi:hypothetical protein [Sporisorium scitamineum]|uniref:Uncharacterized protein n=1 Tax=Sporisorium scitamineum TaxID=49012 RepID=A0A0F7S1H1_9BASI|nr:hypothetical protein [Sporisorium scitamineum]
MQHAREIVADMIQMLQTTSLSRDSVTEYYGLVLRASNSLASKAKELRDEARNRGVKTTIAVDVEANHTTSAAMAYTEGGGVANKDTKPNADSSRSARALAKDL